MSRILVLDAESRTALATVRSLGRAGYEVHVCSHRRYPLARASRYVEAFHRLQAAPSATRDFAIEVTRLVDRVRPLVTLPVTDASMSAVLEHAECFQHTLVPGGSFSSFSRLSDKATVLRVAERLGIPIPLTIVINAPDERPYIRGEDYPVAIKSASIHGKRVRGRYAANESALLRELADMPRDAYPVLVQQRIIGPGVGVFLLRWNGHTLTRFAHRRLREQPPAGGMSVYSESIALDGPLQSFSEQLLDFFKWRGVAMVEFKVRARDGMPFLMEVNPRLWGSLQLAIDAGVDFPFLLVKTALGETVEYPRGYTVGQRLRNWWADVDHLLAVALRSRQTLSLPREFPGALGSAALFVRRAMRERNETLRTDDPAPFLVDTAHWLMHIFRAIGRRSFIAARR